MLLLKVKSKTKQKNYKAEIFDGKQVSFLGKRKMHTSRERERYTCSSTYINDKEVRPYNES